MPIRRLLKCQDDACLHAMRFGVEVTPANASVIQDHATLFPSHFVSDGIDGQA